MNMTLGQEHSRSALPRSTIYGSALFISFRNIAWTLYSSIPGQATPVVFRQKSLAITLSFIPNDHGSETLLC